MKRWNILVLGIVGLLAILFILARHNFTATKATEKERAEATVDGERTPVLVELFTSEGCSSCPPADEVLARLEREQPVRGAQIIVLSQHVDYWNDLGWADPYSSADFSARQNGYAEAFQRDGVYTPQMVVDGCTEFVGSNWEKAREAILSAEKTRKAAVQISRGEEQGASLPLNIRVENLPPVSAGDTAEVLLALTESDLHSSVARGENAGRSLSHTAVVRQLNVLGSLEAQSAKPFIASPTINLASEWKRQNLHAVAFVQERASRRILGAASVDLAK